MKNISTKWILIGVVVIIGLFAWSKLLQRSDPRIVAQKRMTVNGEESTEYESYQVKDKDATELYYTTSSQSGTQSSGYKTLSVDELRDSLAKKDFTLVNVHVPYVGEIEGTDARIPYNEIAQNTDRLPADKNAKIVLYCQSGRMSAAAAQTLTDLGYTNVFDTAGGMIAWQDQGYPLVQSR